MPHRKGGRVQRMTATTLHAIDVQLARLTPHRQDPECAQQIDRLLDQRFTLTDS